MTATYRRPPNEELAADLAFEMGARVHYEQPGGLQAIILADGRSIRFWNPADNRNDSALAVERCIELGLHRQYVCNLWLEKNGPSVDFIPTYNACEDLSFSSSDEESFAAHKTLFEHNQQEQP